MMEQDQVKGEGFLSREQIKDEVLALIEKARSYIYIKTGLLAYQLLGLPEIIEAFNRALLRHVMIIIFTGPIVLIPEKGAEHPLFIFYSEAKKKHPLRFLIFMEDKMSGLHYILTDVGGLIHGFHSDGECPWML